MKNIKIIPNESILMIVVLILGLISRISLLQDWLIYSDSYKFILISRAISKLQDVTLFYPQVEWSFSSVYTPYKWLYPILIGFSNNLINWITNENVRSWFNQNYITEHFWVIFPSLLSSILLFQILKRVGLSKKLSLVGYLLMLFSGTMIIWTGFIITEPLAVSLMLLLFLLTIQNSKLMFKIGVTILLFLTRPELIIVGIAVICYPLVKKIVTWYKSRNLFDLDMKILELMNLVMFIICLFLGQLYKENFVGDAFVYISFLCISIIWIFQKDKLKFENQKQSELFYIVNILLLILSFIYFNFNNLISRYVLILLPLIILSTLLLFSEYQVRISRFNENYLVFLCTIFVIFQMSYALSFPKYQTIEFQREEARVAMSLIGSKKDNQNIVIYAMQPEGLLIEDSNNSLVIRRIMLENCNEFPSNSYILIDNSYNEFCRFDKNNAYEFIGEFTTKAFYRRDNNLSFGKVEIWKKV